MGQVLSFLAIVGGFAVIMTALAALAARIRRRKLGGGLMGPLDEIYNPSAHRLRQEIAIHEQRMTPIPPAEDQRRPRPPS
jgi:hypothetical protein